MSKGILALIIVITCIAVMGWLFAISLVEEIQYLDKEIKFLKKGKGKR